MKGDLIQKLALIYVKAHTNQETSAKEVYEMYKSAVDEIQTLSSADFNAHISSQDFSL